MHKKWKLKSDFEKKFQDEMKEVAEMVLEKEADDWVARSQKKHAGGIDRRILWTDITRGFRHPESIASASFAYFM